MDDPRMSVRHGAQQDGAPESIFKNTRYGHQLMASLTKDRRGRIASALLLSLFLNHLVQRGVLRQA